MATFRQLPSGKWQAQVRRHGAKPITKSFANKLRAEKWARQVENQIDEGRFRDYRQAEAVTMAEVCDYYSKHFLNRSPWPATIKPRIAAIRALAGPYTLAQLQARHVVAFVDKRLASVSADCVLKELSIWSRMIKIARSMMQIPMPSNPVREGRELLSLTQALKPGAPREYRISDAEIDAICDATRSPVLAKIVRFVGQGCTAMRRGEIVAARREHLSRCGRFLHIPETKTDRPRTIPLAPINEIAIEIVKALPAQIDGSLFGVKAYGLTQAFRRAAARAGRPELHFHDLRHEATSRLFEAGLSIPEVAAITGHADWKQLRRYTHLQADRIQRRAAPDHPLPAPRDTSPR